jgi:hypothetical protein
MARRACFETVATGPRAGDQCGSRVSVIIAFSDGLDPFYVCGYHARAYTPAIRYPLWANLAQLRRLQMANIDA